MDSLTILASLRPRTSSDNSEIPPLIPSPTVLHKLHRALPLGPSRGWHGTLPPARPTALRDDSTVRLKLGAKVPAPTAIAAPAVTPTPAAPAPAPTAAPVPAYPGYNYSNYTAQQYRGGYAPYKPGQTPTYYPATYAPHAQGAQGQTGTTNYYTNQGYSTTGQQQYSYGSWYNYQPQAGAATTATSSGQETPQPAVAGAAPAAMPTTYGSFFNNATPQQAGQRAVANTVVANKPYQQANWAAGATPGVGTPPGYAPPTLPPHLRTAAVGASGTPQPGAPGMVGGAYQQHSYYGAYAQPTPSAAR